MPKKYLMSWEGAPAFRWRKLYRKAPYAVTCKDLGLKTSEWTKEKSYLAANEWWQNKLNELNSIPSWHPHQDAMDDLQDKITVASQLGLRQESQTLQKQLKNIAKHPESDIGISDSTASRIEALKILGIQIPDDLDPATLEAIFGDARLWADRKKRIKYVPSSSTARHHADRFLKFHLQQQSTGIISVGRFAVLRLGVNAFASWFGESRAMTDISESIVLDYFSFLQTRLKTGGRGNASETIANCWQVFRQFIDFCSEENSEIPLPRNLRSRKFRIAKTQSEIEVFSSEEIEVLISNAPEKTQLYLLLMLNCGMYQIDISELNASEIDWDLGRIVRTRSKKQKIESQKSKKQKSAKVNYLLWDRTFELLLKFGNRSGLALLNQEGLPLVRAGIKESGTDYRQDAIKNAYSRVVSKLKNNGLLQKQWTKPLKSLRKTGANIIEQSEHAEFVELFLDHSSVAKRHYLQSGGVNQKFDDAIRYVGEQFGFQTQRF